MGKMPSKSNERIRRIGRRPGSGFDPGPGVQRGQRHAAKGTGATKPEVRLVIADDHRLLREGLRALFAEQPGLCIAGEAADGAEALRLVDDLKPDLLILDLALPRHSGLEVAQQMKAANFDTRIIFLTATIEPEQVREAFRLGARGIILKESPIALLLTCVKAVLAGQIWFGRKALADPSQVLEGDFGFRHKSQPANFGLTKREMEILAAIVAGKPNRELAEQFSISEQTVKHHVTHIFDKVGVYNRLELMLFALHQGLVRSPGEVRRKR
jgi:two-component system, NarL family, nitrate/nitrite response regulator NarL